MVAIAPRRKRPKLAATVEADLLAAVDAYVLEHPGTDRSKVIDEALRLWRSRALRRAMEDQYASPDERDPDELAAWRRIRRTAAARQFRADRDD